MAAVSDKLTMNSLILLLLLIFPFISSQSDIFLQCIEPQCKVVDLELRAPLEVTVRPLASGSPKLCVLCYPGQPWAWHKLWVNPRFSFSQTHGPEKWDVFTGNNVTDVVDKSKSAGLLAWPQLTSLLTGQYAFPPFNHSCIGVQTSHEVTLNFVVKNPEPRFLLYTALGIIIFLFAPAWSRNIYLHYASGISFGVLGSLLVVIIILNKFLPQRLKMVSYTAMAISASAFMFVMRWMYVYFQNILMNYWQVLLGYVCVAGLISFSLVYRYGPVSDPRSLDLIKWLLQILGLCLVYQGSQIPEMGVAIIGLTVTLYMFPRGTLGWITRLRNRYFPPKRRLLSMDEYDRQGQEETEKALKELRDFCASPDCNAWKTMSRLTSPSRFASFMEGDSHILDDECSLHESTADINPLDLDGSDSEMSELSFRMGTK